MKNETILITGGCGFVGSSLALLLREKSENTHIICLDNLKRRGSEMNIPRLREKNITFVHGDIRCREDLVFDTPIGTLIECSAEPSVQAGYSDSPDYVIQTNLAGTLNCLELARQNGSDLIFLSTSRVYPLRKLKALRFREGDSRFELLEDQPFKGISKRGVSEEFPLDGARSLYGATKLSSELMIQEYAEIYGIRAVINRCGILTGPWQFGKADQGVVTLWMARHFFRKALSYTGFGGTGKQVRDILHVNDLFRLIDLQMSEMDRHNKEIYNVGGGSALSLSLLELTALCEKYTDTRINIEASPLTHPADIPVYITDTEKVAQKTGWKPEISKEEILSGIFFWLKENRESLSRIFN